MTGFVQPRIRQSERWAGELCVRDDWVVLDTETTGMRRLAQVIELALVNADGLVIWNQRMRPSVEIEPAALAVHGIAMEDLEGQLTFKELRDAIREAIAGRRVMIYNEMFDRRILYQTANAFGVKPLHFRSEDVMEEYAEYVGDWSDYYQNYVYQKLPGTGHSACADALATWRLIRKMGNYKTEVPIL